MSIIEVLSSRIDKSSLLHRLGIHGLSPKRDTPSLTYTQSVETLERKKTERLVAHEEFTSQIAKQTLHVFRRCFDDLQTYMDLARTNTSPEGLNELCIRRITSSLPTEFGKSNFADISEALIASSGQIEDTKQRLEFLNALNELRNSRHIPRFYPEKSK